MTAARQLAPSVDPTPATVLPVAGLRVFQRLMAYDGWQVDLERLCTDPEYAQACLVTAHTSGRDTLRQAAIRLFEAHRRNAAHGLH